MYPYRSRTLNRNLDSELQNLNENTLNLTNQNTSAKQAANSTVRGGELNGLGDGDGEGVAIGDFGSRQRGSDVKGIGMI